MFHLLDDRPGSDRVVRLARPGPLRVCAQVRATADAADLTGLRVLLMADLLTRAAELRGLQVLTTRAFTGEPARQAAVERAADALVVHPPVLAAADSSGVWPGGPADVHVADDDAADEEDCGGILIRVAAARLAQDACLGDAVAGILGGHDPLAVRFALLSLPRQQPTELSAAELADAAQTLAKWRRQVAVWAQSPSRRIPEPIATTVGAAFDNLDTVAALSSLRGLAADETVPPGARFEAFVYTDRVLGLDLPRDIGRLPAPRHCVGAPGAGQLPIRQPNMEHWAEAVLVLPYVWL
jgi:hypothetical protein